MLSRLLKKSNEPAPSFTQRRLFTSEQKAFYGRLRRALPKCYIFPDIALDKLMVATSTDGVHWKRLSDQPLLANGKPGEWNSSESGHPGIFNDEDGKTWLFFQGNNDKGRTWYLSKVRIDWKDGVPVVAE